MNFLPPLRVFFLRLARSSCPFILGIGGYENIVNIYIYIYIERHPSICDIQSCRARAPQMKQLLGFNFVKESQFAKSPCPPPPPPPQLHGAQYSDRDYPPEVQLSSTARAFPYRPRLVVVVRLQELLGEKEICYFKHFANYVRFDYRIFARFFCTL